METINFERFMEIKKLNAFFAYSWFSTSRKFEADLIFWQSLNVKITERHAPADNFSKNLQALAV